MKRLKAEFEEQTYTQIIFPHPKTDWMPYLDEAQKCFIHIIHTIQKFQTCLIICYDIKEVQKYFKEKTNLIFIKYETDDTWARDCSAISIEENSKIKLLNFTFNAWGGKFNAQKDNLLTSFLNPNAKVIDFVLEGGGIESNGKELLLTTEKTMLNQNRNKNLNQQEITQKLKNYFGIDTVCYLKHGYLAGDDTDSHIDTLARFANEKTILYIQCKDMQDEHFTELSLMEKELQLFAKKHQLKLVALPMCDPLYYEEERLPATYANFLFLNGAILVPVYGINQDKDALEVFKNTFPKHQIIPIDCAVLLRQHGSLHCVTMQFFHPAQA